MPVSKNTFSEQSIVLAKAVLNASKQLGLTEPEIANTLGMTFSRFSNLKKDLVLDPREKEGELALHIIQIAQRLYALTGGNQTIMKNFMHSHNKITGGVPIEQMVSHHGLMNIVQYV